LGPKPRIYNRATYAKEMREAPERWAEHVKPIAMLDNFRMILLKWRS
jgi:hypothetical protein